MHYPPEILDEIVSHLVYIGIDELSVASRSIHAYTTDARHVNRWDAFTSCAYNPQPASPVAHDDSISHYRWRRRARRQHHDAETCFMHVDLEFLYKLRLVSPAWNATVLRIFQRHYWWPVDIENSGKLRQALELCSAKTDTSRHWARDSVRKLAIPQLNHVLSFKRVYQHGVYEEPIMDKPNSTGTENQDKSAELDLLCKLVDQLPCIEALSVMLPPAESRSNGIEATVQCYSVSAVEAVLSTIMYCLRSPSLEHLTTLHLTVPGTHEVGLLAAGLTNDMKMQLKDLWIKVVDSSGPGGSRHHTYEYEADIWDDITDRVLTRGSDRYQDGTLTDPSESGYPQSNLQIRHPNREHQNEVWDFVSSCPNLDYLGISATHYLDLERLEVASRRKPLRALYLSRMHTKASTLIDILRAACGPQAPSPIRRVEFYDLKIKPDGGSWKDVFEYLEKECPDLQFFCPNNIGYLSDHEHFEHNNRPNENSSDLWTEWEADCEALASIIKSLVVKAGGTIHYPADFECLEDYEQLMETADDRGP
ncbi:hypothetical protein GGR57DRAFT_501121 [Xylariaceae sp. FL1272]|nr:hypothetical protein GGR57DRAFT_501121 [Xylariaceae sp. FL1272]